MACSEIPTARTCLREMALGLRLDELDEGGCRSPCADQCSHGRLCLPPSMFQVIHLHEGAGLIANSRKAAKIVPPTTNGAEEVAAQIVDIYLRRAVQHRQAASNAGPVPGVSLI